MPGRRVVKSPTPGVVAIPHSVMRNEGDVLEHMERVGAMVYELLPPDGPPGESSGKLNLAAAARIFRRRRKVGRLA